MGPWWKHGFWNTLEHALTRAFDALASLVLLWALAPELYARLAVAQAIVAPCLLFFLSPETVIYRDYARWRAEGSRALAARLGAFRRFALFKAVFAALLTAVVAEFAPIQGSFVERWLALVWAFALALAPQIAGPDREFLRLHLSLRALNVLSLYQKASLLAGTVAVAALFHEGGGTVHTQAAIAALGAVSIFSAASTAFLAWSLARRRLAALPGEAAMPAGPDTWSTLVSSLESFSLWQHLTGVVLAWMLTIDLLFLGSFVAAGTLSGVGERELGLYGATAKIAGLALAAPLALANLFALWLGRRHPEATESAAIGIGVERRWTTRFTTWLVTGSFAQAVILLLLAPWYLSILSRGRWSEGEQSMMRTWLAWMLASTAVLGSGMLLASWMTVRTPVRRLLVRVYVPWAAASLVLFGLVLPFGGSTLFAAQLRLLSALVFIVLLGVYVRSFLRSPACAG